MTKLMKHFLMALMAVVFIGIASCGKDDEPSPTPNPDPTPTPVASGIYGTWLWTSTETDEDGITTTSKMVMNLAQDQTGYVTITETIGTRAELSFSNTEYFSWTSDKDSNNRTYISFIHTGGDEIFGNSNYYYAQAANALSMGDMTFVRQ